METWPGAAAWRLTDSAGVQIAVVLEFDWNGAASPAVGESPTKIDGVNASVQRKALPDWGSVPVTGFEYDFETSRHIFTILRREDAGSWLLTNWHFAPGEGPRAGS
jgi:hypothetical protein